MPIGPPGPVRRDPVSLVQIRVAQPQVPEGPPHVALEALSRRCLHHCGQEGEAVRRVLVLGS